MDNFPYAVLIELGDLSARVRVVTQPLRISQYGIDKRLANIRYTLLQVMRSYLLEITQGRRAKMIST
jgi:hypothetical protein